MVLATRMLTSHPRKEPSVGKGGNRQTKSPLRATRVSASVAEGDPALW